VIAIARYRAQQKGFGRINPLKHSLDEKKRLYGFQFAKPAHLTHFCLLFTDNADISCGCRVGIKDYLVAYTNYLHIYPRF
jgi:hypothetical protein